MQPPFSWSRQRPCEFSPAFQSRESSRIVVSVAERRLTPSCKINRRSATENGYALIDPALKSRAKLNRRCGDEEMLLHLFLKDHKSTAKVRRRAAAKN